MHSFQDSLKSEKTKAPKTTTTCCAVFYNPLPNLDARLFTSRVAEQRRLSDSRTGRVFIAANGNSSLRGKAAVHVTRPQRNNTLTPVQATKPLELEPSQI